MDSIQKNARVAGVLFIAATVTGILSVVTLQPVLDSPDYLIKVTEHESRVMIGTLLQYGMAFACAGIAIGLYPALRRVNEALALGAVGFRLIEAAMFTVGATSLLSLLTLGQEYVKAGTADAAYLQAAGALALATRGWIGSVSGAMAFALGALMYYAIFYQSKLIPRWLSGWGFIAAAMHLLAVLTVVFGAERFSTTSLVLNLPILVNELVLAVWLIVKGFDASQAKFPPAAQAVLGG